MAIETEAEYSDANDAISRIRLRHGPDQVFVNPPCRGIFITTADRVVTLSGSSRSAKARTEQTRQELIALDDIGIPPCAWEQVWVTTGEYTVFVPPGAYRVHVLFSRTRRVQPRGLCEEVSDVFRLKTGTSWQGPETF